MFGVLTKPKHNMDFSPYTLWVQMSWKIEAKHMKLGDNAGVFQFQCTLLVGESCTACAQKHKSQLGHAVILLNIFRKCLDIEISIRLMYSCSNCLGEDQNFSCWSADQTAPCRDLALNKLQIIYHHYFQATSYEHIDTVLTIMHNTYKCIHGKKFFTKNAMK